ncbi:MAG: CHRD domain-containing protein [Burkholderiales bacterium]
MKLRTFLIGVTFALVPAAANAVVLPWSASLDTAQAIATTGGDPSASGTGSASGTYDTIANILTWNVSVSGLSAPATLAHFHGPSPGPGTNAGVRVELPSLSLGTLAGNTSGDFSGSMDLDLLTMPPLPAGGVAQLESELLGGHWYLNVHTSAFPAGEIRGQISVPEPGSLALCVLALTSLLAARGRRRM